jgi:uncharacterized membrane protein
MKTILRNMLAATLTFGVAVLAMGTREANAQMTFTPLGDLAGGTFNSRALCVSADGGTVSGYGNVAPGREAFLWRPALGMIDLGEIPGGNFDSVGYGVSNDGNTIVGLASPPPNGIQAFRWTPLGMVGIGNLPGGDGSFATGVSGNGTLIVGEGILGGGFGSAFLYSTATGTMSSIGDLPGGFTYSSAKGISNDGTVIFGESNCLEGRLKVLLWVHPVMGA